MIGSMFVIGATFLYGYEKPAIKAVPISNTFTKLKQNQSV